jgi:transposase
MPAERPPMRQVREVLRLKYVCGQSGHRIAAAIGISRYTVAEYLRRAAVVAITWPVPPELDDMALERKLFTPPGFVAMEAARPQPDWSRLHTELRRPGTTWRRSPAPGLLCGLQRHARLRVRASI